MTTKTTRSTKTIAKREASRLDKIFADFEAQPALMSTEQIDEFERTERSLEFVIRPRRAALFSLTMSGKEMSERVQKSRDDAGFVSCLMHASDIYIDHLRRSLDLMETAKTRCQIALCNAEDMQALIDETAAKMSEEGGAA